MLTNETIIEMVRIVREMERMCRAKEKIVQEWLPRPFCGLYELKIQK